MPFNEKHIMSKLIPFKTTKLIDLVNGVCIEKVEIKNRNLELKGKCL